MNLQQLQQIEVNRNMTEVEQLRVKLHNWLVSDRINELYKDEDPEEYQEYLEEIKASFTEFGPITQVNYIFYKVETNDGDKYFYVSPGYWEGYWEFEEVSKEEAESY